MAVGVGSSVLQSRSIWLPNKNARSLNHEQMKVYMKFMTAILIIQGNIQGLKNSPIQSSRTRFSHWAFRNFSCSHTMCMVSHLQTIYKLRKGFKSLSYTVLREQSGIQVFFKPCFSFKENSHTIHTLYVILFHLTFN